MANEKNGNPLIGAFRSPVPNASPPEEKKVTEQPKATPPAVDTASSKTTEERKPAELPKAPVDGKDVPPVGNTSLAKPAEEKKPTEPAKATAASKGPDTAAPGKPDEDKENDAALNRGEKAGIIRAENKERQIASLIKTFGHDPITGMSKEKFEEVTGKTVEVLTAPKSPGTTSSKPTEEKKTAEPSKVPAEIKASPPTGNKVPGKPIEEKKPAGPSKAPADSKANPTAGNIAPSKPAVEPKIPSTDEDDLPQNLHIPLAPTEGGELVTRLKLDEVHAFEGHPYSVKEDKDMWDLVESVKQFGVLEPAMVIPRNGGGYEIVSGHRRHRASQLAGLSDIPVIIRNLDRDEAIISMVDANLKRENISPMEKARAYDMKLSALQRKAGRRSKKDILTGEKPKQALEVVAEQTGESISTIKRIRNLVNLEPELQDMVEKKVLPVNTAADISYLKPEEQKKLVDAISREDKVPSGTQATELKKASQQGKLTPEKIEAVVAPSKKETNPELKVTFNNDELRSYFPDKATTVGDVKRVVFEALSLRARALERQAKKEAESKSPAQKPKEKQR